MENESINMLNMIFEIKNPLKKLILEFIPANYQLKLCKSSQQIQNQIGLNFNIYKYLSLLQRKVPIKYNNQLKEIIDNFKIHKVNFQIDNLGNILLFKRVLDFTYKNITIQLTDLYKSIEIYLLDNPVPYLLLTCDKEYELFDKFFYYFKDTLLFCIIEFNDFYKGADLIRKNKEIANNVIYIHLDHKNCDFDLPNLQYLSLGGHCKDKGIQNFNYYSKNIEWGNIFLTPNLQFTQFNLSVIKHLSLQISSKNTVNVLNSLSEISFNELISLSITSIKIKYSYQQIENERPAIMIQLALNRIRFPKLKHLYVEIDHQFLNISFDDIEFESLVLKSPLENIVAFPCSRNISLLNVKKTLQVIRFESGIYANLEKLKLNKLFPLDNIIFPNVSHFYLKILDIDTNYLKPLIEMIRQTVVSLSLNLESIKENAPIYSLFFANFPNVKRIKITLPLEKEELVFKYITKYVNLTNLTKFKIIFDQNCPDSVSWKVIDKLIKYPFPLLESFSCINIAEGIKLLLTKEISLLKKFEIRLKRQSIREDVFDSFDHVYPFFKIPHQHLQCLIINNKRFNPFVNYSLRKYKNLYSYVYETLYNYQDGLLINSHCIIRNSHYKNPQCIIF